ncbi:MAG TPA: LLM class F420-dependent oxidoreductase [Acidimicrobiales bacterium]|nr:LLM class F420-dependent oxidoreductase [Acidimicrobiales bacterium]
MKIGLISPVVMQLPDGHSAWEETAGVEELVAVAEAADRLGYHHLTCSEHVVVPVAAEGQKGRGAVYWDPLATLSFLAARTSSIRLLTNVLVLGYHHPLELAKSYGTLDRLSGGRVMLGVGVGSLEEEFELLGRPFADRGARADDSLRAVRAAFGREVPEYSGPYYRFSEMAVIPHGVQSHVPIWVGGRTGRSLRRAIELGDGWMPMAMPRSQLTGLLDRHERGAGFEVVLSPPEPLDPVAAPDRARQLIDRAGSLGATTVNATFVHESPAHYLEQLEALTKLEVMT